MPLFNLTSLSTILGGFNFIPSGVSERFKTRDFDRLDETSVFCLSLTHPSTLPKNPTLLRIRRFNSSVF